jgi:heptaprenyl diphosphate synthase
MTASTIRSEERGEILTPSNSPLSWGEQCGDSSPDKGRLGGVELLTQSTIHNPQSLIRLNTTAEDHHIARMAAVALGLTILENAIPSPLPGVKPGLANIVTLIVLARYGWRTAAWVSLLRVVAGSLLFGNFLSPGFFLSLSGAVLSLIVLAFAQHLPARWFGPVSHSIYAAFAHITGQMLVVYLWLIPHAGIAYLIPVFATAALVFGTVNGLIAARFMDNDSNPLSLRGRVRVGEAPLNED